MLSQRLLSIAAIPYALWLIFLYRYHFIDGANLLFHEAGHVLLGFFGQTLHVLGGTLSQLLVPSACVIHFWVHRQRVEAALCGVWFAESMMYMAAYLGDAQAQRLPLVGGHIHDWHWLLTKAGVLSSCKTIAVFLHIVASAIIVGCVGCALRWSFRPAPNASLRP